MSLVKQEIWSGDEHLIPPYVHDNGKQDPLPNRAKKKKCKAPIKIVEVEVLQEDYGVRLGML